MDIDPVGDFVLCCVVLSVFSFLLTCWLGSGVPYSLFIYLFLHLTGVSLSQANYVLFILCHLYLFVALAV